MFKLAFMTAASIVALSGAAMAADLALPAAAAPIAAPAPTSTWDGPYIGVFAGYGWGSATASGIIPGSPDTTFNLSGFQLGVQGGYNFTLSDSIVAGVSADVAWNNASGSGPVPTTPFTATGQYNWTGSVTGRLGVNFDSITPYVLAGVAFANVTGSDDFSGASNTQTLTGYTVGVGAEFALAEHLSANIEYRYSNYGSAKFVEGPVSYTGALSDSAVRIGLNYHF